MSKRETRSDRRSPSFPRLVIKDGGMEWWWFCLPNKDLGSRERGGGGSSTRVFGG